MQEFKNPEALREYLLSSPGEFDEEIYGVSGSCYSLSWKKDHWIIRLNNKKIGTINNSDISKNIDIKNPKLVLGAIACLRKHSGSLDELQKYLKDFKNA